MSRLLDVGDLEPPQSISVTILYIADEDPLTAKSLAQRVAQETGCEVRVFATAAAVVTAARQQPSPDVLIVGLGDAGLELAEQLKLADPALGSLHLTSADPEAIARTVAAVGPLCHLIKPCEMSELLPKLQSQLERRGVQKALLACRAELAEERARVAALQQQMRSASAELRSTHSELATATERLVQAEQLAAVGRVVTGIAHELSRQLALVGYAEAIKARVAEDAELVEFADVIVNAQKRLAAMVDEIRDFAAAERQGPGQLDREPADVVAAVDEALAILAYDRDVRQRKVRRRFAARPLAALHRDKFSQVIVNLVANAVLATEVGDTIDVGVTVEGQSAVITVRDSGAGMPADVLARLGEPFFTTRGDRGSGLGVGICMRIVEEHGGLLSFQSKLGAGTAARVMIPLLIAEGA